MVKMTRCIFFILIVFWSYSIVNCDGQDLSHSTKSASYKGLQEHLQIPFYAIGNVSQNDKMFKRGKAQFLIMPFENNKCNQIHSSLKGVWDSESKQ